MKAKVLLVCFVLGLLTAWVCAISVVHAAADLAVISVSGPPEALLNQTISLTYTVKNKGDAVSVGYEVGLYLSEDKTIEPTADRLLKKVPFGTGLSPGQVRKRTTKVTIPNYHVNGLAGSYHYGAIVELSTKASRNPVTIVRYQDNGDGTVLDFKTGVMWQKSDDGVFRIWADALSYCDELELGGYDDWILPSMEQMSTITDYSRYDPATDPAFDYRSNHYWSSSTVAFNTGFAWNVNLNSGQLFPSDKRLDYYVCCVRSGP
jgi:hypothetical protein